MTIPATEQELVSRATFKIHTKEGGCGQCALIEDGLIITASHCVDWTNDGGMALGDYCLSKITTDVGIITASVAAVEPVSDIAILECPDAQTFSSESSAFDNFSEAIIPVKLSLAVPDEFQEFPVWVWTHLKTWVAGTAIRCENSTFGYTTDVEIHGGTSGGPIVNASGELVGVVSQGSTTRDAEDNGKFTSFAGLLPLALPVWVVERVKRHRRLL